MEGETGMVDGSSISSASPAEWGRGQAIFVHRETPRAEAKRLLSAATSTNVSLCGRALCLTGARARPQP